MTKTIVFAALTVVATQTAFAQSVPRPQPAPAPVAAAIPAPAALGAAPAALPWLPAPLRTPRVTPPPVAQVPAAPVAPLVLPPEPPAAPASPNPFVFVTPPDPPQISFDKFNFDYAVLEQSLSDLKDSLKLEKFDLKAQQKGQPFIQPPRPFGPQDENLYDQARGMIERDQYDRALPVLDRVIDAKGNRVDAAMYWKAYSLSKLARRPEALAVIADLEKQFPNGAWTRDARALDVELRQASGQAVSADVGDDEVKLLALRGLMQNDPETAVPIIEKMLAGNSSVRVKDRALFVLSQSRSSRARDVITGVAMNGSNPDLRASAVKYLALRSEPESLKVLADIYASTTDVELKRTILRSFVAANARDRLMTVARTEKSAELRMVAIQQLGAVRGSAELEELYRSEQDKQVKQRILQSFIAANASDKLAAIARTEKDPDLQQQAIRNLGVTGRTEAAEALRSIYQADSSVETKKVVINALSINPQNAAVLVALAKAEKNPELKTEIVRRLSTMRSQEARDYMVELLK